MEQNVQDAIETVDSAREHKCELEGRQNQLNAAISQVETTAEITRKEIQQYFAELQQKVTQEIQTRVKVLLEEVNQIEQNSIDPLRDCNVVIKESIDEASAVVTAGDNLLNQDIDSEACEKQLKKFVSMADSLPLDSLPEVPTVTEVPSISVIFDEGFVQTIQKAIRLEGTISKQSPVQIIDMQPRPGGIIVKWNDIDDDVISELKETGHKLLYKVQCCLGRVSKTSIKGKRDMNTFREEYIGPETVCTVRNLSPNTVYTFRVCRCIFQESNGQVEAKQWSPWSIYQEKMTTMSGFRWATLKDSDSFAITEKFKTASKKNGFGKVLYSDVSDNLIGFPVTLKIEAEGKTRNKTDCIALCTKRDPDATGLHTKEGTLCLMADGHVYVNGTLGSTKFSSFSRGIFVTFKLEKVDEGENQSVKSKMTKPTTFRVSVVVGEREAVFDWHPFKSLTPCSSHNLAVALMFSASGWKISFI
uniref:Class I cytokine receptor like factor 3 n=1 Tax=Phallusia mammillata TaxID=59560 RepID=A0A6F9DAT0_9ASCI|nr:class I cytokine receptor like factor 3 [Phallusia mammillata]